LITRVPADAIARRTRIPKKLSRPLLSVLIMLCIVGGIIFIIAKIASEAWELFSYVGESGALGKILALLPDPLDKIMGSIGLAPQLQSALESGLSNVISGILSKSASLLTGIVSAVPKILFFILVTAVSTVYFSIDIERINGFFKDFLPDKWVKMLIGFKNTTLSVMLKYTKAYLLIMLITFTVVLLGLTLIGSRYSLLLAFVTAIMDLLPLIGVGVVLIPYSLIMFATNSVGKGIGLLVLYAILTVTREIAEPKIIGKNLGIHPLLTLIMLYVGYELMGFFGILLLPLLAVIVTTYIKRRQE
jgi:sporulation integral membrane protein YtvI